MFYGKKNFEPKFDFSPLAAARGQEEECVVFSQYTGNVVDIQLPLFPSFLCINLLKKVFSKPGEGKDKRR